MFCESLTAKKLDKAIIKQLFIELIFSVVLQTLSGMKFRFFKTKNCNFSHFKEQIKIKHEIIALLNDMFLCNILQRKKGEKSKDDCFRCSLFHVNNKLLKNTNPEDRLCIK